jgi:GNAT superfamily N-acetyltransferase
MRDNPGMELRQASTADTSFATSMLAATMGDFGVHILGLGSREKMLSVIAAFFCQPGNRFSHDATQIAMEGGELAGLLLSFRGGEMNRRTVRLARPAFDAHGVFGISRMIWRAITMGEGVECRQDEYYIAHLAVHPNFRRKGIGRFLLDRAEEQMHVLKMQKLSLIVDQENEPAVTLYHSYGFEIMKSQSLPALQGHSGLHGYHRMVKTISPIKGSLR